MPQDAVMVQDDFDDGLQGFEAFKMDWVVERQQLLKEVDELRQHKDWADRRIDALLKRATGAERPQIAETNRLRDEVLRLRQVSLACLHTSSCPSIAKDIGHAPIAGQTFRLLKCQEVFSYVLALKILHAVGACPTAFAMLHHACGCGLSSSSLQSASKILPKVSASKCYAA